MKLIKIIEDSEQYNNHVCDKAREHFKEKFGCSELELYFDFTTGSSGLIASDVLWTEYYPVWERKPINTYFKPKLVNISGLM